MSVTAFTDHISVEEYIAREARSAEKHDYVDGAVYAMAGAPKIPGGWISLSANLLAGRSAESPKR